MKSTRLAQLTLAAGVCLTSFSLAGAAVAAPVATPAAAPAASTSASTPASKPASKPAPSELRQANGLSQLQSAAAQKPGTRTVKEIPGFTNLGPKLNSGQTLKATDHLESAGGQHLLFADYGVYIAGAGGWFNTLADQPDVDPAQNRLVMQADGNLVLYNGSQVLFNARTNGNPGAYAMLQSDGNFVVYSAAGRPLYATGVAYASSAFNYGGQRWNSVLQPNWFLKSPDGRYRLVMQTDGNLVLYSPRRATWSTKTNGNPGATFSVQSDGNLVVYNGSAPKWWSGTKRAAGFFELNVQNNGNVVLYHYDSETDTTATALWQTRTAGVS